jgi:hypothetical protein
VDRIDNPGDDQREPLAQTHGLDLLLDDAVLIAFDSEREDIHRHSKNRS